MLCLCIYTLLAASFASSLSDICRSSLNCNWSNWTVPPSASCFAADFWTPRNWPGNCSCYTFHDVKKSWKAGNLDCKSRYGLLVSMETLDEWKFINTEIQKRNTSDYRNEWYIGLRIQVRELDKAYQLDEKRKANWKWTSGRKYTHYNKWQPNQPNGKGLDLINTYFCVVMAKEYPRTKYGLLKDTHCAFRTHPYICEYGEGIWVNPTLMPVCWNKYTKTRSSSCVQGTTPSASTLPVITNRVNGSPLTTTNDVPVTTKSVDARITTTTLAAKTATTATMAMAMATNTSKDPVSSLAAVFIALFGLSLLLNVILIVYFVWKRKKGRQEHQNQRQSDNDGNLGNMNAINLQEIDHSSKSHQNKANHVNDGGEHHSHSNTTGNPSPHTKGMPSTGPSIYENMNEELSRNTTGNPITNSTGIPTTSSSLYEPLTPSSSIVYGSLSPDTKLPKKPHSLQQASGIYQELQPDVHSAEYQSLDPSLRGETDI